MADVGFARGNVSPIIYFESANGHLVMPVYEAGRPEQARQVYEARFKPAGFEWRETRTLAEVDTLQKRLVAQECERRRAQLDTHDEVRREVSRYVAGNLRARMVSAACSEFEKNFIRLYLELRDDAKRDKFRQRLLEHQSYLWAREMDSGTKIDDRMPMQDGEFWRGDAS
jgi:hypothetical protein